MPVPGHDAQVLPLEPGHGAQISARTPTKGYVQTGVWARAPSLNGALVLLARFYIWSCNCVVHITFPQIGDFLHLLSHYDT